MNPYKILGIGNNASVDEIKKAFREKAAKHHPDLGGDQWAFEQIKAAYEMLMKEKSAPPVRPTSEVPKPKPKPAAKQAPPQEFPHPIRTAPKQKKTKRVKDSSIWFSVIGSLLGALSALVAAWFIFKYAGRPSEPAVAKKDTVQNSVPDRESESPSQKPSPRPKSQPPRKSLPRPTEPVEPIPNDVPLPEKQERESPKPLPSKPPRKTPENQNPDSKPENGNRMPDDLENQKPKDDDKNKPANGPTDFEKMILEFVKSANEMVRDSTGKTTIQLGEMHRKAADEASKKLTKQTISFVFPVRDIVKRKDGNYQINFSENKEDFKILGHPGSDGFVVYRLSESEAKDINPSWSIEVKGKLSLRFILKGHLANSRNGRGYVAELLGIAETDILPVDDTSGSPVVGDVLSVVMSEPKIKLIRPNLKK